MHKSGILRQLFYIIYRLLVRNWELVKVPFSFIDYSLKITIMTKEEVLKRAEATGLTFEVERELALGSTPDDAAREWDL